MFIILSIIFLTTYEDDDIKHYDLKEDVDMDDLVIPSSNIDKFGGDGNSDENEENVKKLQVQITELKVEIQTAKCALL